MASQQSQTSSLYSHSSSSFVTDFSFGFSLDSSRRSSFIVANLSSPSSSADMTDGDDGTRDVSAVMTEVLQRLSRIVEHFRDKGEPDAANHIAKNTIATVKVFNDTIAPWDIATATMRPPCPSPPYSSDESSLVPASVAQKARSMGHSPPRTATTSWAAVAAVAPAAGNKVVKFTPSDTVQAKAREAHLVPSMVDGDSEKRVVWIRGWSAARDLCDITNRIGQGPIYSMAYSEKDSAVCVIFQYAYSAKSLCEDDKQYIKNNGHSRFGPGCDVVEGLPFPDNEDIRRMLPPFNERRRLTFARSQLFTHGLTEDKFKQDICSIVGKANTELIWLFNTGNATVVLSAVPLARLIRNEFMRFSKVTGSPYQGVVITFSHDPCERPMTLITQMQTGRPARPITTYGRSGVIPAGITTKNGSSSRRNTMNEIDGWQTVSKRR